MSKTPKIFCIQCNGLNVFMSKMSKMLCTECNRLNGTHVEVVEGMLCCDIGQTSIG